VLHLSNLIDLIDLADEISTPPKELMTSSLTGGEAAE
jgi:hypothetical protein